jgi:uncharacterized protein YkwD
MALDAGRGLDAGRRPYPGRFPDAGWFLDPGRFADAGRFPSNDVPNTRYCVPATRWTSALANAELTLFDMINRPRTGSGGVCGRNACNLHALQLAPELRCSARLHSEDMATQHYFAKQDPDGTDPAMRMARAGFTTNTSGECIVQHASDAMSALQQLNSGSDPQWIANFTNPQFTYIGIGHDEDLWTIDFAR